MEKFRILSKCEYCQGKAYLPEGEAEDYMGRKYVRYKPCPRCGGSGMAAKWVATGVKRDGKRAVLRISVSLSEAEAHWRSFLEG